MRLLFGVVGVWWLGLNGFFPKPISGLDITFLIFIIVWCSIQDIKEFLK